MKKTQAIVSLIIGLSLVFGVVAGIDSRYAKSATVSQVSERLDRKILNDRLDKLQERMWAIEDRWGERFIVEKNRIHDDMDELLHFMTPEARDHYRRLEKEYKEIEKELKQEAENG